MLTYKCYGITLEDGSFLQDGPVVSVESVDLSEAVDRAEHLVSITGVLESVVGHPIESYSYMRIEDAS